MQHMPRQQQTVFMAVISQLAQEIFQKQLLQQEHIMPFNLFRSVLNVKSIYFRQIILQFIAVFRLEMLE